MADRAQVDISRYSFDEFIAFVFDRNATPDTPVSDAWYSKIELTFDPQRICDYYTRLFRNPRFLLERFSKTQLEEGFWAIQGGIYDCSVQAAIWIPELPFAAREECVRSMLNLFSDLFALEPLETAPYMWWDGLCFDWDSGNRKRERGGEDLLMQDVMFQTLSRILELDSDSCQDSALHGLGHLHHPETEQLVRSYVECHPLLTKERREYAFAAARFDVL
jgi:hypothetical protein